MEMDKERTAIRQNMARETDVSIYDELRAELQVTMAKISELKAEQDASRNSRPLTAVVTFEQQVAEAMSLFDDLTRIANDSDARPKIRLMLERIGFRIGLFFVEAIKGKKWKVRRLAGGVLAFGTAELPVKVHGSDAIDGEADNDAQVQVSADLKDCPGRDKRTSACSAVPSASQADARPNQCHQEESSLTKVSRAERI